MRPRAGLDLIEQPWAGFVDLFSNLILFLLFTLLIFMVSHFLTSLQLSGSSNRITVLSSQMAALSQQVEKAEQEKEQLYQTLSTFKEKFDAYAKTAQKKESTFAALQTNYQMLYQKAVFEKKKSLEMAQQVQGLNFLIAELEGEIVKGKNKPTERELNRQLHHLGIEMNKLNTALEASDQYIQEQEIQIVDLSTRLNRALAGKTAELQEYQSVFFKDLSKALEGDANVKVKGDRFVIQSELLFKSGSTIIENSGQDELSKVARIIQDFEKKLPQNVAWIIRVDGHTDATPVKGGRFKSNWDLSTARAVSVVEALIKKGVTPKRLAAAGFGEYQPITAGATPLEQSYNRRIEFYLTQE